MRFISEDSDYTDLTFTECNNQGKIEIEQQTGKLEVLTMYISRADALVLAQALLDYGNSPTPGDL
ncbi:hypothetical protein D3C81_442050 [compost metagenome]